MRIPITMRGGARTAVPALALALILLPAAGANAAEAEGSAVTNGRESANREPVRVYTNEDLERLPPLPQASEPLVKEEGDWNFVLMMLDREREIQERERAERLEQERLATARAEIEQQTSYRLAYPYFFPFSSGIHRFRPGLKPFGTGFDPHRRSGDRGGKPHGTQGGSTPAPGGGGHSTASPVVTPGPGRTPSPSSPGDGSSVSTAPIGRPGA